MKEAQKLERMLLVSGCTLNAELRALIRHSRRSSRRRMKKGPTVTASGNNRRNIKLSFRDHENDFKSFVMIELLAEEFWYL